MTESLRTQQAEQRRQLVAELARLEMALIGLAELAAESNRDRAGELASDAVIRLSGVKRSVDHLFADHRPKPMADLVTVSAEVLERLRLGASRGDASIVREPVVGYRVSPPICAVV